MSTSYSVGNLAVVRYTTAYLLRKYNKSTGNEKQTPDAGAKEDVLFIVVTS